MFIRKISCMTVIITFLFNATIVLAESIQGCKEYSKLGIPGKQGELLCRTQTIRLFGIVFQPRMMRPNLT